MRKIGVFDSGIGGLSVAMAIERALPNDEVVWVSDRAHVPYGDKTPEQVHGFVLPILQKLERDGCEAIVIACNSVTTTLIETLRKEIHVPLIGIEPMVKPAATLTKSNIIAICATPMTLASKRYAHLKETYAHGIKVLEPDCAQWAYMIEQSKVNEAIIAKEIDEMCVAGADAIVLGCTHYHWIERTIKRLVAGRAAVLQPEQAVVAQLKRVLS